MGKGGGVMLYLFDLDDTLITSYMRAADKNYNIWDVLPGRVERLRRILDSGEMYGIVTNQAGVAWGHITESDVRYKLHQVAQAFDHAGARIFDGGVPFTTGDISNADTGLLVWVCYADPRASDVRYQLDRLRGVRSRRKPSGVMIREAAQHCGYTFQLPGVLYVGDQESDLEAARDAGVSFQWAHIFFKDEGHE